MRADPRGLMAGQGGSLKTFALMVNEVLAQPRASNARRFLALHRKKPLFFNDLADFKQLSGMRKPSSRRHVRET